MATGRKGPKPVEKKAAGDKPHERDGHDTSIVATVERLAALVAEHSLSELIVETSAATITLRRGGTGAVGSMPIPMPMAMPAMPPMAGMAGMGHASGAPFTQHHAPAAAASAGSSAPAEHDDAHVVTSPFVGTFYRRPNPDSSNYVELHARVEKGHVLCIVEAMKLMNEIEADVSGTIVGVLVEDGAAVEYGQALFKIAP